MYMALKFGNPLACRVRCKWSK